MGARRRSGPALQKALVKRRQRRGRCKDCAQSHFTISRQDRCSEASRQNLHCASVDQSISGGGGTSAEPADFLTIISTEFIGGAKKTKPPGGFCDAACRRMMTPLRAASNGWDERRLRPPSQPNCFFRFFCFFFVFLTPQTNNLRRPARRPVLFISRFREKNRGLVV